MLDSTKHLFHECILVTVLIHQYYENGVFINIYTVTVNILISATVFFKMSANCLELVQELECLLYMLQFTVCRNKEGSKGEKEEKNGLGWEGKWNGIRRGVK